MKLRNKKTGVTVECESIVFAHCNAFALDWVQYTPNVNSLAELNEDWEDVEPVEPLIKDERIRKAVRAWAEADDLDNFRVHNEHFNSCKIIGYTAGINKASFIGFQTTVAHADSKKLYDIAELCGEDEE